MVAIIGVECERLFRQEEENDSTRASGGLPFWVLLNQCATPPMHAHETRSWEKERTIALLKRVSYRGRSAPRGSDDSVAINLVGTFIQWMAKLVSDETIFGL